MYSHRPIQTHIPKLKINCHNYNFTVHVEDIQRRIICSLAQATNFR